MARKSNELATISSHPDNPTIVCELAARDTPPESIEANDLQLINMWGYHICNHWNQNNITLKALTTLGFQTVKFIETRRKLMKMEYGCFNNPKDKRSTIVYPID